MDFEFIREQTPLYVEAAKLTLSFSMQKGEVVIVGPSGCGKSTFLRCIYRLEETDSGVLELDGVSYEKEIRLSEQSALTFYHELLHHLDSQIEPIRPGRLCEAELIAELGASVICALQGITGYEAGSYRYLQMYAEGKEPEAVLKSLMTVVARVEQLVGVVLDAAEEYQISPGLPSQEAVPATA